MAFGVIDYDDEGKPIRAICGKSYHRILSHARQAHFVTERDYKLINGLDLKKGITSEASKEKSRLAVKENWDVSVNKNLVENGSASRFKTGHAGRTREEVSMQTSIALKKHLEKIKTHEEMQESGRKLGLSGAGNLARWGKNTKELKNVND